MLDILGKKLYNINRVGNNITSTEEYDVANIDASTYAASGLTLVGTMYYSFDSNGKQFRKKFVSADGTEHKYVYEYRDDKNVAVQLPGGAISQAKNDSFGRKVFDELQLGTGFVSRKFDYIEGAITDAHKSNGKVKSPATTQLVSRITLSDGRTVSYEYDAEERITKVTDSLEGTTEYTYDALGQLLTEKVNGTVKNSMSYDGYGNIRTKNGKAYTYGNSVWKDLLTSYGGQAISYDAQGNPTSYLGHTLTWEKGRQLKSFDSNAYTYNASGIRMTKTVGGVKHTYTLDGTKIIREVWGGNTLFPLYDVDDSVCGINYNGNYYYFAKNLQGDIIAIVDKDAKTVARYSYDAWGVPTVVSDSSGRSIATINPFRYRGYYYDAEIGMYYLQSRYYNPVVGRFINADDVDFIKNESCDVSVNLYVYCCNDPVIRVDNHGTASSYIDNQDDVSWKNVQFGFWGNVYYNGCGAIALFNVLHAYSKKITFNSVLTQLRFTPGSIIYNNLGVIGTSPAAITSHLSRRFLFLHTAGPITYLWGIKAELSGAIIVLYQNKGWNAPLHYVAGINYGNNYGGSFRFYNDSKYRKKYGNIRMSIWEYIDFLRQNGCKPLLFWGVAGKIGWW